MSLFRWVFSLALACAVGVVTLMAGGAASAQIFCPSSIPGQAGITLQGGTCTNAGAVPPGTSTGAFSNATMASQALSDLSESTTQETTRTTNSAIAERRQAEAERCPDGLVRIDGVCRRPTVTETAPPPAVSQRTAAKKRRERQAPKTTEPSGLVYKAPPVPYVETGVRTAAWTRVFGDYEHRTGSGQTFIDCCEIGRAHV